jgi:hypothetical protein
MPHEGSFGGFRCRLGLAGVIPTRDLDDDRYQDPGRLGLKSRSMPFLLD